MKTFLKVIRFIYLLTAYSIITILYPVNFLVNLIFKTELMFLFNCNDFVLEKLNDRINE